MSAGIGKSDSVALSDGCPFLCTYVERPALAVRLDRFARPLARFGIHDASRDRDRCA